MKYNNILKIAHQKIKYLGYADSTIKTYMNYIEHFLIQVDKYPQHLNSNDFQTFLDEFSFTSRSQQNQIINAVKFLYEKVLQRKYTKVNFVRPRSERKLPKVIDKTELINKIDKIHNLKHKAILKLTYSVGLRVSEVINMKIEDIDSSRMVINIRSSKGNKDRVVPLSPSVLQLLRQYFKKYRPKKYLFNGQGSGKYTKSSCNSIVKRYIGINNSMHHLRHSCFTHLLEGGTDLRLIQKLAGHSSSKTTEIYTHVSTAQIKNIQLPV